MTTPITPEARKAVVEAAARATSGPWKAEGSIYEHMIAEVRCVLPGAERAIAQVWQHPQGFNDAQFLAEANPSTILAYEALVQELEYNVNSGLLSAAEAERLGDALQALEAERAALSERLSEAEMVPWPAWAAAIREKLLHYGVDPGREDEWDIGEDFEQWVDGVIEKETERADNAEARATAAEAEVAKLREALQGLEWSCEQLAATRDMATYEAMIAAGQADALIALDNARRAARAALSEGK